MMALFVPILAQTLSATVSDRAELAARIDRTDTVVEATNAATGMLGVDYSRKRLRLALDYLPSVLVVASPLEDPEVTLLWTQSVGASIAYQERRDEVGVRALASYGERDFRRELLIGAAPVSPGDTEPAPVTPPVDAPVGGEPVPGEVARAAPGTSRFGSARGEAWYQRRLSRAASLSVTAGYGESRSFGESSEAYPRTQSADGALSLAQRLGRRDNLSSVLSARSTSSDTQASAWVLALSESLSHRFDARSNGTLVAGASYNRERRPDQDADWSVYPLAAVSFSHSRPSRDGVLSLTVGNSFNAVIDPVSTSIDPRATFSASVMWSDRLNYALSAAFDTTRSLEPRGDGALQTVSGSGIATWFIGSGFSAEAGVRTAFQSYQQADQLPPTWYGFVALTFGLDLEGGILAVRPPLAAQ